MSAGPSNDKRFRPGRSESPIKNTESSSTESTAKRGTAAFAHELLETLTEPISAPVTRHVQSDEMTDEISKYQVELVQKDELISALINELEKAVEQLDRFERSGANRSQGGQLASRLNQVSDAVETRSPLMDDLRRMADDWEQSQPGALLVRIESQLAAVHDLVRNLHRTEIPRSDYSRSECPSAEVADFEDRVRRLNQVDDIASPQDLVNQTLDESSPSWEAIKKQMLGTEQPIQEIDTRAEDSDLLKLMTETPTPQSVDFSVADINELKQAIVERDAYIVQLNRLFRTRNVLSLPVDWAALANVPGEMQVRVESLIEHLDVQVRLGEVEMSLERARLARERSYIQGEREQIEKHMRRLGLKSLSELDNISAATGTASDRRWMRFLGPNTK